jgi:hypothetical protein
MPQARKGRTKAKDDAPAKATTTKRRSKAKQVEEEVLEDAEDEDLEEADAPSTRRKITPEIAQRAAEMREDGATWQEVIDETGFNGAQLRPHIARLTEAEIDTLEDTPESVAEHREQGYAWYAMAISLGKSIGEIKDMAEEGGAEVEGRKYRSSNGNGDSEAEADQDDEQEDDEDEEEQPKPKRKRAGKATASAGTASTATKAKPKRGRKANPSDEG